MTLAEALQSDEVKSYLDNLIRESVEEALPEAVKAAWDEQAPALRESLRQEVRDEVLQEGELGTLHAEATRLIESSKLPPAAKANLLSDYSLDEVDGKPKAGRGLALVEAVTDTDGKITKTAKAVLREAIEADIKRQRNVLRESAPTVPFAPGGGSDTGSPTTFDIESDPDLMHLRESGLAHGLPPAPEKAKA